MTKRRSALRVSAYLLGLGLLLTLFPGPKLAQPKITVIEGGTLIDGTGREPIRDALIIINGNKFVSVSQIGKIKYAEGARVIKANGKFILPGLIDMHVHYDSWMPELFLAHGVTSIVDLGSWDWVIAQKEGIEKGKIPGPRIFTSSFLLDGRLFWDVPFYRLENAEMARRVIRDFIDRKVVDVVKVYNEITPDKLRIIVEEAHKAGLPVMGHLGAIDAREATALGIDGLAHASGVALATITDPERRKELQEFERLGIAVDYPLYLEYHAFMDPAKVDELVRQMVQKNVRIECDLINTSRWAAARRGAYEREDYEFLQNPSLKYVPENVRERILYWQPLKKMSPREAQQLQKGYVKLQSFIVRFVNAGGKVLAGTDSSSFVLPGLSLHREMELLVEAGLSPMQAIVAATKNNAEFLRKQAELGTIEQGKLADLVILKNDPLQDIRNTKDIELVMKSGEILDTSYHAGFFNPIPAPPPPWGHIANPIPTIKSIRPMTATEDDKEVKLLVEGSNFIGESVVKFDRIGLQTTPVRTTQVAGTAYLPHFTQLEATIPGWLLKRIGTFPITVANPRPEGGESSAVYFFVKFR